MVVGQKWKKEDDDTKIYNWAKSIQKIFNKNNSEKSIYINFKSVSDSEHYDEKKLKDLFGENL